MAAKKTAATSRERWLQARISELEAENAQLRGNVRHEKTEHSFAGSDAILESITDAFVAIDREFRFTWINTHAERLIGQSREHLLGRCLWDQFPGTMGTPLEEKCREAMTGGNAIEFEYYSSPSGRWFFSKVYPKEDGGLAIFWREITAQKIAEADVRSLEREVAENTRRLKFQADILNITNDPVIALDSNLCIRYCNAAAERKYGVALADVVGKPMKAIHDYAWLAPEDEERCLAELTTRGIWKGEYIHILHDGSQMVAYCTVNVLPEESGGGMVSVIRDVTERKQAELLSRRQAQQLQRANEDLLHFAYGVAHDLQAPVRTITTFSELLAMTYKTGHGGESDEIVSNIVNASTRLTTMIRDLLSFAQAAGGEIQMTGEISLEDALARAIESHAASIARTGAQITHDPLPKVIADAAQFAQLFQNLIENSLKYRKPDVAPRIHVSVEQKGDEWIIAVRDNGIGFKPEYAERIFSVFQRLHHGEFAGTGIGLTICKRIVERRGGRIWAEGQSGEGALFSFSIPNSLEVIPAAMPLPWDRVKAVFADRALSLNGGSLPPGAFGELFHTLDLAKCVVRDLAGRILIWTQGAEKLFGFTQREALGQRAQDLLHKEFPKPLEEVEAELLSNGEWAGPLKAQKKDGSVIWLSTRLSLHRNGIGRPQSVIEIHTDMNESVRW